MTATTTWIWREFTLDEHAPISLLAEMDTDAWYLSMTDGIEDPESQTCSKMNLHTCKHCGAWLYRFIVRGKMNVETCFCGSKGSVAIELRRSFPLKPLPPAVVPLYTSGKLAHDSAKYNGLLGMTGLTLPSDPSIKGQNHPRFNAGFKIKGTGPCLSKPYTLLLATCYLLSTAGYFLLSTCYLLLAAYDTRHHIPDTYYMPCYVFLCYPQPTTCYISPCRYLMPSAYF